MGSPCSSSSKGVVDLAFLNNGGDHDIDAHALLQSLPFSKATLQCFGHIGVMHARLEGLRDAYPAGPSNMFFGMFLDAELAPQLARYSHMFWMEWDVTPIRPHWVDCLLSNTQGGRFWVKGSMLQGGQLDAVAEHSSNWDWIAHINGNGLYALHDPEFTTFIRLTVAYEPPNHYWKPFDISMWRVLHAFPYTWHIYQRYRPYFQHADFIMHYSFLLSDVGSIRNLHPATYLVHGSNVSAGNVQFQRKFRSKAVKDVTWDDRLSPSHNVSILVQSYRGDAVFAVEAVRSAVIYMPAALEIVVVVPASDEHIFQAVMNFPKTVVRTHAVMSPYQELQQNLVAAMAGVYCQGDFIFHLESNVVFFRMVLNRDLFWLEKPVREYARNSSRTAFPEHSVTGSKQWLDFAVGNPMPLDFKCSSHHMYPRAVYANAQQQLLRRFNTSLVAALEEQLLRQRPADSVQLRHTATLCKIYEYMDAYTFYSMPDAISWRPQDSTEADVLEFPSPIIPPFTCHGDASQAQTSRGRQRLVMYMRRSMTAGKCAV